MVDSTAFFDNIFRLPIDPDPVPHPEFSVMHYIQEGQMAPIVFDSWEEADRMRMVGYLQWFCKVVAVMSGGAEGGPGLADYSAYNA